MMSVQLHYSLHYNVFRTLYIQHSLFLTLQLIIKVGINEFCVYKDGYLGDQSKLKIWFHLEI